MALVAALLTAVMAVPVLLAPGERILGSEIVGRHHDPFTVMRQFAGATVPEPYLQPVTDWTGRALAHVLPPVAAYSVVVLATFPLAALFAYWLAFDVTRSRLPSTVAALAFAFSPFHIAHAAYHPHIAQVQWVALYLLALWRCLHGFTGGRAALLALAALLVTASNFYGGFIAMVLTPVVVPLFWLSAAAGSRQFRDLLGTAALLGALGCVALVALATVAPEVLAGAASVRAEYEDLYRFSARWWAHFVPPVDHAVLGPWAQSIWTRYGIGVALLEQQVYLGFGTGALAAVACWCWLRRRDDGGLMAVPALAAVAAVAVVCALSPSREIAGWQVARPSAALYELAPMFRGYARFSVVVQLMTAILAGIGARVLWQSSNRAARATVIGLLALSVFEYAPVPWRSRDVLPTSAHRWLAGQGGAPHVFDCARRDLGEYDTAWLAGYAVAHADTSTPDCGDPDLAPRLDAGGSTHLVVRTVDPAWALLMPPDRARRGLRLSYRGIDSAVFDVVHEPSGAYLSGMHRWFPREYKGPRTWRWSSGRSALTIRNPDAIARTVHITMALESFAVPRRVDVAWHGVNVDRLTVGTTAGRHRIGPVIVPPGENMLSLTALEPGLAPKSLDSRRSDTRPLAFRVLGDWTIGDALVTASATGPAGISR